MLNEKNQKLKEDVNVNPNMNVQGMGTPSLPGDPGSMNNFANQSTGSGDLSEPKNKKSKVKLMSYNDFIKLLSGNK